MTEEPPKGLRCSFCGKRDDEVDDMIAGPTVLICDCCILLASDIVQAARERRSAHAKIAKALMEDEHHAVDRSGQ